MKLVRLFIVAFESYCEWDIFENDIMDYYIISSFVWK